MTSSHQRPSAQDSLERHARMALYAALYITVLAVVYFTAVILMSSR
jgi:hypothetical protein